jgi:phage antirepressor YoqD-like protein
MAVRRCKNRPEPIFEFCVKTLSHTLPGTDYNMPTQYGIERGCLSKETVINRSGGIIVTRTHW